MRRFTAAALALFILCGLFCTSALSAADVIFVAINDSIPSALSEASMPFYSGGALYLPYTVFNTAVLGIVPTYNSAGRTLTLTSDSGQLVFDISGGTASDASGTSYEQAALIRYGIVFVPAGFCVVYFGLSISYLTSLGGYPVVRLKTGDEVYSDTLFIEKAENLISYRAAQYVGAQEPTAPETPDNSGNTTPPPAPPEEETPEDPEELLYYTAVTGISASLLDTLDSLGVDAALFLTDSDIQEHPDLVRRAAGSGYTIGLMTAGAEDPISAAERANDALRALICQRSLFVFSDAAAEETLKAEGYAVCTLPDGDSGDADVPLLLLSAEDASVRLSILLSENAALHPLRETTFLPAID